MFTTGSTIEENQFGPVLVSFILNYTGRTANWNLLFARFSVQHLITYLIFMLKICIEDRAAAFCLFLSMNPHTPAAPLDGCGQLYSFCHKFFVTSIASGMIIAIWFLGVSELCFDLYLPFLEKTPIGVFMVCKWVHTAEILIIKVMGYFS